jgi:hypothetical protein
MTSDNNKIGRRAFGALGLIAAMFLAQGCVSGAWKNPHGPTFNGTIQSSDIEAHRLTVAPLKPGEAIVFTWDERSRFWANGLRVEPTFLQARDTVRIHYQTNSGHWTVQHLYLQTHRTVH